MDTVTIVTDQKACNINNYANACGPHMNLTKKHDIFLSNTVKNNKTFSVQYSINIVQQNYADEEPQLVRC